MKKTHQSILLTDMLRSGSVNSDILAYLWTLLDAKAMGLVVGTTGTGKTTVVNTLLTLINAKWNITAIEHCPELRIPHAHMTYHRLPHNFREYLDDGSTKEHTVTPQLTLKNAIITNRSDFIVLGETRDDTEVESLLAAAGTGVGCITTYHAASAANMLKRLHNTGITESAIGALWFVVLCGTVNGKHVITDVTEVFHSDGVLTTNQIFRYDGQTCLQVPEDLLNTTRYVEACNAANIKEPEHDFAFRKHVLEKVRMNAATLEDVFNIIHTCKTNHSD